MQFRFFRFGEEVCFDGSFLEAFQVHVELSTIYISCPEEVRVCGCACGRLSRRRACRFKLTAVSFQASQEKIKSDREALEEYDEKVGRGRH